MAESHQQRPLFGGNTLQYQRARRNSSSSSSSAESLSDMIQFQGSVLDYHFQEETADDSDSSAATEHTQPEPTLEPNDPHDTVNSTFLDMPSNAKSENANEEQCQTGNGATWHPFWLKPTIFGSFCGLFLCFTVALPLMLLYSKRNDGLFESSPNFVYVWRFSPTASKLIQVLDTSYPSNGYIF